MSQMMELELLKEIPGYNAILKSVIKTQIQLLIEQLSNQTGEESIILTASVNDGTLSHLGSDMGKGFFVGRDEIKSQFLGYCLKKSHEKTGQQSRNSYPANQQTDSSPHGPTSSKRQKLFPKPNTSQETSYENQDIGGYSPPVVPIISSPIPNRAKARKLPIRPPFIAKTPVSTPTPEKSETTTVLDTISGAKIKLEVTDESQDSTSIDKDKEISRASSSVSLNQEASDGDAAPGEETEVNEPGTSIKLEPVTEGEMDLEITGVEMAAGATGAAGMSGDWGQDISGEYSYLPPSESGEDTHDQSNAEQHSDELDDDPDVETKIPEESQAKTVTVKPRKSIKKGNKLKTGRDLSINDPEFQKKLLIKFAKSEAILKRIADDTEGGKKKYLCKECDYSSDKSSGVKRHVMAMHKPSQQAPCYICGKGFTEKSRLQIHIEVEHEGKRYVCDICGKDYKSAGALRIHRRLRHTNTGTFKCSVCDKTFSSKSFLREHLSKHAGTKELSCPTCEKKFRYSNNLKEHQTRCRGIPSNEASYKCHECDSIFGSKKALKYHVNGKHTHLEAYTCGCGKMFSWRSSYSYHRKICTFIKDEN